MTCTRCGNALAPGAAQCPVCGAWADTTQQDMGQNQQGMHQNQQHTGGPAGAGYGFSAGDTQNTQNKYATPAFHTYRKQMLTGFPQNQQSNFNAPVRGNLQPGNAILKSITDLPQLIRGAFVSPTAALQGLIRKEDRYTGGILFIVSLILAFLAGMILTRGILGTLLSAISGLTGIEIADSTASLNQGVNYLSGKIAVSVGGVAAVCQLIAALVPVLMTMAYLSILRQVKLTFLMVSGFAAILLLPNLIALLLASVLSLITPYLSLVMLFFGQVISYILLCTMAAQIAEIDTSKAVPVQAALVCTSELMKLILFAVIGGAMMSGIVRTLSSLTSSLSGLL